MFSLYMVYYYVCQKPQYIFAHTLLDDIFFPYLQMERL